MINLVAAPAQQQFGQAKSDTLAPCYCLDCDVRFACHGGCPKDRFATTPDGEPGLHCLCPSYKAFFGHIRPAMTAMRLRQPRNLARCAETGRSRKVFTKSQEELAAITPVRVMRDHDAVGHLSYVASEGGGAVTARLSLL